MEWEAEWDKDHRRDAMVYAEGLWEEECIAGSGAQRGHLEDVAFQMDLEGWDAKGSDGGISSRGKAINKAPRRETEAFVWERASLQFDGEVKVGRKVGFL